jgi:hypothetical protein
MPVWHLLARTEDVEFAAVVRIASKALDATFAAARCSSKTLL